MNETGRTARNSSGRRSGVTSVITAMISAAAALQSVLGTVTTGVWNATAIAAAYLTGIPKTLVAGRNTTDVTGAGSLSLYSYSVPINTLINGRTIRFCFLFSRTTGSGTVTVRVTWGGVSFETTSTGVAGPRWVVEGELTAAGDAAHQRGWIRVQAIANTTAISQFGFAGANNVADAQFASDNGAGAVALALAVTLTTSTDHVTMRSANISVGGS